MLVRQPAAIIIGQAHAPGAQLAAEAPVFFDQVGDDLPFPAGQPVGHDHQQQVKGRGIDHAPELVSRPRRETSADKWNSTRLEPIDNPFGPKVLPMCPE